MPQPRVPRAPDVAAAGDAMTTHDGSARVPLACPHCAGSSIIFAVQVSADVPLGGGDVLLATQATDTAFCVSCRRTFDFAALLTELTARVRASAPAARRAARSDTQSLTTSADAGDCAGTDIRR